MTVTLTVGGQVYQRWVSSRVTRSLKRVAGGFEIETPGEIEPPIMPFSPCVLADDGDPVITGYVDEVRIEIGARETRTRITGRSKTGQLVDCAPNLTANQFNGSAFDALARAVAAPFGIKVVIGAGVKIGEPFADATFEWSETAYRFLERLARQRGILLTDDAAGDLVLAALGTNPAPAGLATGPGGNVYAARGVLSGKQRFSQYTVRSQAGMIQTGSTVDPSIEGQSSDAGVPLFRPLGIVAESALLGADAQQRADWEASHRLGLSVQAVLSVPEWRAGPSGGRLWLTNQLARCDVPRLGLADTLLIGGIDFSEDEHGRRTDLTVALPAAYNPEPLARTGAAWAGITAPATGNAGTPTGAKPAVNNANLGT